MKDSRLLEIKKLYLDYGFAEGMSTNNAVSFTRSDGYFQLTEILFWKDGQESAEKLKKEYEQLGYSVRIARFSSPATTHENLFQGFFQVTKYNNRVRQEVNQFYQQLSEQLAPNKYKYISGKYLKDNAPGSQEIIDEISNIVFSDSPKAQLVILEAAAGYGKTCTTYEILNSILDRDKKVTPLQVELSKNKIAPLFRYVLLSEINNKFQQLKLELVIQEIKNQRIPLIIDGFDELLSKDDVQIIEKNEKAQTMLETIADLLQDDSKARIILTTRRSSFMTGELFDRFTETRLQYCDITRFQLLPPRLDDWLSREQMDALKTQNITINGLSSPVLLNALRSTPAEDYYNTYRSIDDVWNKYVGVLLKREKVRQTLILKEEEQLMIMEKFASMLVELDISCEDIDFIKYIFEEVTKSDLDTYLERYSYSETRITKEEFLEKLCHHAFLDRTSYKTNQVGFLNDFIFGMMISEAVLHNYLNPEKVWGPYLDRMISASCNRSSDHKKRLFNSISKYLKHVDGNQRMDIDLELNGRITTDYKNLYFQEVVFDQKFVFEKPYKLEDCMFYSCTFIEPVISLDVFKHCQFIKCRFYDAKFSSEIEEDAQLVFSDCFGIDELDNFYHQTIDANVADQFEKIVLEQFWKPGSEKADPRRAFVTIYRGVKANDRPYIDEAVKRLIERQILIPLKSSYEINFDKISEVKQICGRNDD